MVLGLESICLSVDPKYPEGSSSADEVELIGGCYADGPAKYKWSALGKQVRLEVRSEKDPYLALSLLKDSEYDESLYFWASFACLCLVPVLAIWLYCYYKMYINC